MNTDVPRMPSVKNLHSILDAMQRAAVPDAFGMDFLKDLGFTSSNDRSVLKVLKFLGLLDASGRPQTSYRDYMDHTKSKKILADCIRHAYDDLFKSDKNAFSKSAKDLTGWFKTKTGAGAKVAEKMATTFKALASYADFSGVQVTQEPPADHKKKGKMAEIPPTPPAAGGLGANSFGLTYRIEVHLPDTTNVDTFRAIFRAIRDELMS
jgi:hypothetical protein